MARRCCGDAHPPKNALVHDRCTQMASVHECLVEVGRHVQSAAVSALIAVLTCTLSVLSS